MPANNHADTATDINILLQIMVKDLLINGGKSYEKRISIKSSDGLFCVKSEIFER